MHFKVCSGDVTVSVEPSNCVEQLKTYDVIISEPQLVEIKQTWTITTTVSFSWKNTIMPLIWLDLKDESGSTVRDCILLLPASSLIMTVHNIDPVFDIGTIDLDDMYNLDDVNQHYCQTDRYFRLPTSSYVDTEGDNYDWYYYKLQLHFKSQRDLVTYAYVITDKDGVYTSMLHVSYGRYRSDHSLQNTILGSVRVSKGDDVSAKISVWHDNDANCKSQTYLFHTCKRCQDIHLPRNSFHKYDPQHDNTPQEQKMVEIYLTGRHCRIETPEPPTTTMITEMTTMTTTMPQTLTEPAVTNSGTEVPVEATTTAPQSITNDVTLRICQQTDACRILEVKPHATYDPMVAVNLAHDTGLNHSNATRENNYWLRQYAKFRDDIRFEYNESTAELLSTDMCRCPTNQQCPTDNDIESSTTTVKLDSFFTIKLCSAVNQFQTKECCPSDERGCYTAAIKYKLRPDAEQFVVFDGFAKVDSFCKCTADLIPFPVWPWRQRGEPPFTYVRYYACRTDRQENNNV